MSFIRISAQQARDLIANEALVVDIRDPQSYAAGCIQNAVHITADNVDDFILFLYKHRRVYINLNIY